MIDLRKTLTLLMAGALSAATAAAQTGTPGDVAGTFTGPTSSQTPYVVPTAPGWSVTSLITVGDAAHTSPYVMVGLPDGLGALAGKWAARMWPRRAPPIS